MNQMIYTSGTVTKDTLEQFDKMANSYGIAMACVMAIAFLLFTLYLYERVKRSKAEEKKDELFTYSMSRLEGITDKYYNAISGLTIVMEKRYEVEKK